jgi:hypothetical protein
MIDSGLALIDRFIQLLVEHRSVSERKLQDRRRVIQDLVEPLVSDLGTILKNYYAVLDAIERKVTDPFVEPTQAIAELRTLRSELEPLRTKVRAMAIVFLEKHSTWDREPEGVHLLRS